MWSDQTQEKNNSFMNIGVSPSLVVLAVHDRVKANRTYGSECKTEEFGRIIEIEKSGLLTVMWDNDDEKSVLTSYDDILLVEEFHPDEILNYMREVKMFTSFMPMLKQLIGGTLEPIKQ